jgi:hypothetical protein
LKEESISKYGAPAVAIAVTRLEKETRMKTVQVSAMVVLAVGLMTTAATGGTTGSSSCFPRAAYDSGWIPTPLGSPAQTYSTTLAHGLGGNVDDYVVDLQKSFSGIAGPDVMNKGIGNTFYYSHLTASSITVSGPYSAIDAFTSFRVRIWVYNCGDLCTSACCGFSPGDRVVLLVNNPRGAVGLVAGMEGTVICCDSNDPSLPIFVSWDRWTNGRDTTTHCDCTALPYTLLSGWWVGCQDIWAAGGGSCHADFAPYERPDQGLSPSTIHAGEILNLTFGVVNNGTEAIAPGWRIQYFASLDTNIQQRDGDYLLCDTTADFGIEPGQRLNLVEAFTFPSTVPAGQYYIGWIFDPLNVVCESNEDNNTGCVCTTGGRLTVTDDGP